MTKIQLNFYIDLFVYFCWMIFFFFLTHSDIFQQFVNRKEKVYFFSLKVAQLFHFLVQFKETRLIKDFIKNQDIDGSAV